MSMALSPHQFPSAIKGKLQTIRWRHAAIALLFALALASTTAVAMMLVAMAIDWLYPFAGTSLRIGLTGGTLLASLAVAAWLGIAPVRRALQWARTASAVDANIPELEQRWSTVASLSARDASKLSPLERAMAAQVTSEAITMQRIVVPKRIESPVSLRPAVGSAAVAIGLVVLVYAFAPLQTSILLQRFFQPTSTLAATRLTSLTGDDIIPRGESIDLRIDMQGLPRSVATLAMIGPDGRQREVQLRPDESDGHFVHRLRVDESFSYRLRAGDAETPWHQLHAIDYPELEDVRVTIDFPKYTGRQRVERDRFPSQIKVVQGSKLRVAFKSSEPLQRCAILISDPHATAAGTSNDSTTRDGNDTTKQSAGSGSEEHVLTADEANGYQFEMTLYKDVLLQPRLVSRHGLASRRHQFTRINVIPDQAPVARVIKPTDEMAVAEDATIEIEFEAHDDHGIATAELVIFDESQRDADGNAKVLAVQPIDIGDQRMQRHVMSKATLDLKQLGLSEGRQVSYAVRVTDNREVNFDDLAVPAKPSPAHTAANASKDPSQADHDFPQQMLDASPAKPSSTQAAKKSNTSESDTKPDSENITAPATPFLPTPEMVTTKPFPDETVPDNSAADRAAPGVPTDVANKHPESDAKSEPATNSVPASPKPSTFKPSDMLDLTGGLASVQATPQDPTSATKNPAQPMAQQNSLGQNAVTDRRRIKITATLSARSNGKSNPDETQSLRETVVEIDRMLAEIESETRKLVERAIADADRGEQWQRLDESLANVETFVANLREQTKENQFAFVGLQMLDIARTHVTPARDRVFAGMQRPAASDVDAKMTLQHIVRARELLAALLKRYDRVEQERKLKDQMDKAVTMYEVYTKKRNIMMREARQTLNPLDRKMGIVTVDQAYLDRLAEVIEMRRAMMEEFARMLGDDPRLLSRYLELTKRRQTSLRDRLTEISQRQFDLTEEMQNWLQIDDSQREDLWSVIIELRLAAADDLAKDAAELSERVAKQIPLEVEIATGTPAETILQAKQIATTARSIRMDADHIATQAGKPEQSQQVRVHAQSLILQCERLFSLLDRLQFENRSDGLNVYVQARIQEARSVADQANLWANLSTSIVESAYHSLIESEQHRLAISTQLLRVNMLEMEQDLNTQFDQFLDTGLPGDIADMIRSLHRLMESITFNQLAASYRSGRNALQATSHQQQLASDRLAEAEALFDKIRRVVVDRLDENNPNDPNIADLRDPSLDAFLAQLEREPNIATQLGIPNRPTNLRVQADAMLWQASTQAALGMAVASADGRAQQAMKMQGGESDGKRKQDAQRKQDSRELSAAEKEEQAAAKRAQDDMAKTLAELEKQRRNDNLSAAQRERIEQMEKELRKLMEASEGDESAAQVWQRMVQADEAKELMRAVAAGETIPDDQWNRVMSTLDDGLWQMRGSRPPEAYRKAIEQYQDRIRELLPTGDES